MPLQPIGNWRIVVELLSPKDHAGNPSPFTEHDRAAVEGAFPGAIVAIDDAIALRVAIIIGDRSSAEAQELAQRALERALATSAPHPQLWEIKIHTTGEYVTTKPG